MHQENTIGTSNRGFSLLEALATICILGSVMVVTVPNLKTSLANYKLNVGTRIVATGVQFTRAKAVAENFNFNIKNSTGPQDFVQVQGNENDQGNLLNPWEDRNQNGVKDSVSYNAMILPSGVKFIVGSAVSPAVPVSGSPNSTTSEISFNPLGAALINSSAVAVYLENEHKSKSAITVDRSGRIVTWKLEGSSWKAQ